MQSKYTSNFVGPRQSELFRCLPIAATRGVHLRDARSWKRTISLSRPMSESCCRQQERSVTAALWNGNIVAFLADLWGPRLPIGDRRCGTFINQTDGEWR